MKRFFHSELETMKSHLLLMGERANAALEMSVKALADKDVSLAESVIDKDDEIDDLEIQIDREATRYLTLRAPVASDLRLLTVAIKASHDLERVGDEARNIAKRTRKLLIKGNPNADPVGIPEMARVAGSMLQQALQCFILEDPEAAYAVLAKDEEVDDLNRSNLKLMIKQAKLEPDEMHDYLDLIFISKSLERIADHATNLAEEVIYLMTGNETRHQEV